MDLSRWSNSAGGNTSPSPDGWPENMAPSGVNDSARENMAAIRRWYETAEWINHGHTPTYATTENFTLSGDKSAIYHAGRRIRATDTATLYGTISSATYSTLTRVSVTWDSGAMTASLTSVAVGILSFNDGSMPSIDKTRAYTTKQSFLAGIDVSGTSTFTSKTVFGSGIEVTGTASFASRAVFNGGMDVSGTAAFNGSFTGSAILDEDDMTSNSAVKIPTQQSVKAYVDSYITKTEAYGSNGGIVTVVGSYTSIATANIGTVKVGERYIVYGYLSSGTKGGTAGETNLGLAKSSGTSSGYFVDASANVVINIPSQPSGAAWKQVVVGIWKVEIAGTLIMDFYGTSSGSNLTVNAGAGMLHVRRLDSVI